jgi:hypothetical protein
MSALRGNLRDFGIAEVFQLIGQQRKTGVLEIDRDGECVRLVFDGGAVVMAEPVTGSHDGALADMLLRCGLLTRESLLDLQRQVEVSLRRLGAVLAESGALSADQLGQIEDLLTQETLFTVLRWEDGSFAFSAEEVEHDRGGRLLAAEQILMDGLRMVDEWRTFSARAPSDETVYQRVGRFERWAAERAAEGRRIESARRVFQLIDGRLPVRRVIDLARLGTFEATRVLVELRDAELIEPLDPGQLAKRQPKVRLPTLRRPDARPLLAAALPLVLLVALAATAVRAPVVEAAENGFAWRRQPVVEARAAFETERVRKALEAYRFARGHWPETLADLVQVGLLEPAALTPSEGRPYYYERRENDAVLLAPEH